MFLIGLILILIGSSGSYYLLHELHIDSMFPELPIPFSIILNSILFLIVFIIYFILQNFLSKQDKYIELLYDEIENYKKEHKFELLKTKSKPINKLFIMLSSLFNHLNSEIEELQKNNKTLETDNEILNQMLNLTSTLIARVNETGKVIKANRKFLKFLAYENETKLNMNIKTIADIFDENFTGNWLIENVEKNLEVHIKNVKCLLRIEKIQGALEYVITIVDISELERKQEEMRKKLEYMGNNLKSSVYMNKSLETTMIRIINYENYATHLGEGIMELFQEKFIQHLVSHFKHSEIFKVQNDIFAFYGWKINFAEYKKVLEETIVVQVSGESYIFNPRIVLGSGVNYEQAYQQILETTQTFIPKVKESVKYDSSLIAFINKSILDKTILLGYQPIQKEKALILYPILQDNYSSSTLNNDIVIEIAQEFNLYLTMIKEVILDNLTLLKDYKIILNVSSRDLLSTTMVTDLLHLIKREQLFVVFNVEINSKYSVVYPILKQIKSYAQVSFRKIGNGFISFRDIYSLKVDYLEIDSKVIELVNKNPQWKFLLQSVKLLVSGQKTKLITHNYSDEKILKIADEVKIYNPN